MAEKQIRRLKAQVQDGRRRVMNGRPVEPEDRVPDYIEEDLVDYEDTSGLPPHRRRPCMVVREPYVSDSSKIEKASAKKLLEASLLSLETLGRQVSRRQSFDVSSSKMSHSGTYMDDDTVNKDKGTFEYPSEIYLVGALWLGKNMSLVLEELVDGIESFRVKHFQDVSLATQDNDVRRACHRLSLLATASVNHVLSIAHSSQSQMRNMLQVIEWRLILLTHQMTCQYLLWCVLGCG